MSSVQLSALVQAAVTLQYFTAVPSTKGVDVFTADVDAPVDGPAGPGASGGEGVDSEWMSKEQSASETGP